MTDRNVRNVFLLALFNGVFSRFLTEMLLEQHLGMTVSLLKSPEAVSSMIKAGSIGAGIAAFISTAAGYYTAERL